VFQQFLFGFADEEISAQPGIHIDAGGEQARDAGRIVALRTPDRRIRFQRDDVVDRLCRRDADRTDADQLADIAPGFKLAVYQRANQLHAWMPREPAHDFRTDTAGETLHDANFAGGLFWSRHGFT